MKIQSLGFVSDLDPRYSLSDIHRGDASEMKRLQGHLGAWFSDALSC